MNAEDMTWTGPWVAEKLATSGNGLETGLLGPQVVEVVRKDADTVLVGTIATTQVVAATLRPLVKHGRQLSFFVNVPKEAFWSGEAIDLVESTGAAFGDMGDLYRAMRAPAVGAYQRPEYAYFERAMRQHDNVRSIDRLHDRKYAVSTRDGRTVKVVLLNEYELVAEKVRASRDRYGPFDAILITNPNGKATSEASRAACTLGARALKLGPFMGFLGSRR